MYRIKIWFWVKPWTYFLPPPIIIAAMVMLWVENTTTLTRPSDGASLNNSHIMPSTIWGLPPLLLFRKCRLYVKLLVILCTLNWQDNNCCWLRLTAGVIWYKLPLPPGWVAHTGPSCVAKHWSQKITFTHMMRLTLVVIILKIRLGFLDRLSCPRAIQRDLACQQQLHLVQGQDN